MGSHLNHCAFEGDGLSQVMVPWLDGLWWKISVVAALGEDLGKYKFTVPFGRSLIKTYLFPFN